MPTLAEIIERNRQYSGNAYLVFAEIALPNGTTLRLARDPQSWAWPNTNASLGQLTKPGDTITHTLATASDITISLDVGHESGTVQLQRSDGKGGWIVVASLTRPDAVAISNQPAGSYRLLAMPDYAGSARGIISGAGSYIWQAFNFDMGDYREGEGARRATLQLRVSNASGMALRYMEELEDWRKVNGREPCTVRIIVVNVGLLAQAQPTAEYRFQDMSISCEPPMDWICIDVGSPNVWGKPVGRRILRDFCTWKYVEDCPHVRVCNHTLTACRATYNNAINFGGVPFCGKGAHYVL